MLTALHRFGSLVASPAAPDHSSRDQPAGLLHTCHRPNPGRQGLTTTQRAQRASLATQRLAATPAGVATASPSASSPAMAKPALKTLTAVVAEQASGDGASDMVLLFSALQTAVKTIASAVARAGIDDLGGLYEAQPATGADRDKQKKLDVVAVRLQGGWGVATLWA